MSKQPPYVSTAVCAIGASLLAIPVFGITPLIVVTGTLFLFAKGVQALNRRH